MVDFVVGNDDYGKRLARGLGCEYRKFSHFFYPDGQYAPTIESDYEMDGYHVLVAFRLNQRPSKFGQLLYSLGTQRAVFNLLHEKSYAAGRVDVLMPMLAYDRQDKYPRLVADTETQINDQGKDPGYEFTLASLGKLGAHTILTFNAHPPDFRSGGSAEMYGTRLVSLSMVDPLANYFKPFVDGKTIVVSSGKKQEKGGGRKLAEEFASVLELPLVVVTKKRLDPLKVATDMYSIKDPNNILFFDDIVATGTTLFASLNPLKGNRAMIYVSTIHAVLQDEGFERIRGLLKHENLYGFVITDTLQPREPIVKHKKTQIVSTVPQIVDYYYPRRSEQPV